MLIDIVFIIILVMAIFKGLRKGLILAIFSIIALLVGLAAAIKLSAVTAVYLKDSVNLSAKWLSVLSFVLVFMLAVIIVRLAARAIEKSVEWAQMGWINRIGGILLYASLYIIILSTVLFYLEKIHLITTETIADSATFNFIQPWGPNAINGLGKIIPAFRNMFFELEQFFASIKS